MDYFSADLASRIDEAQIYSVAIRTSVTEAPILSERLANRVVFKREDQQPIFSFKIRGAANKIFQLPVDQISNGVICSSAGNHAQGVAAAAARRSVPAVIVMPESTPTIKVKAVEALGGKVMLHGQTYDDAQRMAISRAEAENLCLIHPFDDIDVIAGQGTIGRELLDQLPERLDAVFVPVGGGGLAAGIATYIKARRPAVKVYGVEPVDAASMKAAFEAGQPVALDDVGTFADGVAVRCVGRNSFDLCRKHLDGLLTVTTDELCAAIRDIFNETRNIVEPAGALALAGLQRHVEQSGCRDQVFVAINAGANMNFNRLGHVSQRASVGDGREVLLAVEIPEEKGSFLNFCTTIGERHITEFNYRYRSDRIARVFAGVELKEDAADRKDLFELLEKADYSVIDLSDDELAKVHLRHLANGSAVDLQHERLYRFEFPERRGALLRFLESVGVEWNISLFHYRNHGSDYGRVLVGVQVPPETSAGFEEHLQRLGYRHWDETDNPAYRLLLQ